MAQTGSSSVAAFLLENDLLYLLWPKDDQSEVVGQCRRSLDACVVCCWKLLVSSQACKQWSSESATGPASEPRAAPIPILCARVCCHWGHKHSMSGLGLTELKWDTMSFYEPGPEITQFLSRCARLVQVCLSCFNGPDAASHTPNVELCKGKACITARKHKCKG